MTALLPADKVAEILLGAGYVRIPSSPLQIGGLSFELAGAFVAKQHSSDLVVIGDLAQDERTVVKQIQGVARALDVMRSRRPLTSVIVGRRPVGKALETLASVGRVLAVEEASNLDELRDRLAILLPLNVPQPSIGEFAEDTLVADSPSAENILTAADHGVKSVESTFHNELREIFEGKEEPDPEDDDPNSGPDDLDDGLGDLDDPEDADEDREESGAE